LKVVFKAPGIFLTFLKCGISEKKILIHRPSINIENHTAVSCDFLISNFHKYDAQLKLDVK
jgi:hypothetical protein